MSNQTVAAVGGGTCCCFLIAVIIVIATSFKTVDQSEWCLKYYWWSESVDPEPLVEPGVVMIGLGNYLISFPNTNKYCYFRNFDRSLTPNEGDSYNRPLNVRTSDGLAITLELEFVYRLQQQNLYKLYQLVGDDGGKPSYTTSMVHVAMGVIDTWATTFSAKDFYTDRGVVADTFKKKLLETLSELLYIDVQSFQLQPAHFPDQFANAIVETQEKKQDIQVAMQERQTKIIQKESQLKNQQSLAQKVELQAKAEAARIELDAQAQNAQYLYRQEVMAQGYAKALQHFSEQGMQANGMTNFLSYMQLEALKAHNSSGKLVRLAPITKAAA